MAWIEFHIKTSEQHAHTLSDHLSCLGAEAVSFLDAGDQPIYEPSPEAPQLWNETCVVGLFAAAHPLTEIETYLQEQQQKGVLQHFHMQRVEDQDWQRVCLDSFKPILFGKRLWICPSWHTPPEEEAVNVILDPGLAFGTGSHPTTALCLEWLDNHITGEEELVIDYGCGSGILGIAAIKLGAKKVLAIDTDSQALEATNANAERNFISVSQLETHFPEKIIYKKADFLIANILAQPIISLAETFAQLIKPSGKIVLSGILAEQATEIIEVYKKWFVMQQPIQKEEWVRLEGKKRSNSF